MRPETDMEDNFSPKQIAEALKVSESSIKRWCDRGAISSLKTHGGHRRITLDGLMAFLDKTNRGLADPTAIGLSSLISARSEAVVSDASRSMEPSTGLLGQRFEEALIRGDDRVGRKILADAYLSYRSFALIADELIAPSFHAIGELWHASSIEVFQERRACEICSRLIQEFRRLTVEPPVAAPLAIGCTASGDHYTLPGQLIEVVLRESGWRAANLGSNIPLESLAAAVRRERPRMVWISVSYMADQTVLVKDLLRFWESIPREVSLVVGGRALTDELRPRLRYTAHCDTMQQLSTLARTLRHNPSPDRAHPI